MGDLIYRNSKFLYVERGRERVLLDCGNLLSNKSRIPMHCLKEMETRTISLFLAELMERDAQNQTETGLASALLDVLLAARLIRTSQPVRVLEYGCLGGNFSWHLASVLGAFHEESSLVCACDRIDQEWLERIAKVEHPPKISFIAGDYGELPLARGYFDIILIGGAVHAADSCRVIEDALRLAAKDGLLLCYCEDAPLLRDTFRLFFGRGQTEEYEIDPFQMLLTANAADQSFTSWETAKKENYERRVREHLAQAEEICAGDRAESEVIFALMRQLLNDASEAAFRGETEQKLRLLEARERLA